MENAASTIKAPKKIGLYDVKEAIGKGAMGEVFLGVHSLLDRPAAIKRKIPDFSDSVESPKQAHERFLREAKVLARLKHQSIVAIYDMLVVRDHMYMVLEYVDGFNLSELLKGGTALPAHIAAIIAVRIAAALEYAHFHRVIHRDVKPANVLLSKDGDVKLTDFGLAKEEKVDQAALTDTGVVMGTPMYLAPELLLGEEADEQTDIYAVGALMYQCLSGRKLFEHASGDVLYPLIVAGRFPKLSKIADDVPRPLIRIVERCLARKPQKRFKTAGELRRALENFLANNYSWSNHAAQLVSYLQREGKVTVEESATAIDAAALVVTSTGVEVPPRAGPWAVVIALLIAVVAAIYWAVTQTPLGRGLFR